MTFNLDDYKIRSGAFADVLIDERSQRAFKLFKGPCHPALQGTGELSIGLLNWVTYRNKVFQNEAAAYRLLMDNPGCAKHAPAYHGVPSVRAVWSSGNDVSSHYMLDCCIEMSVVHGQQEDVTPLLRNAEALAEVLSITGYDLAQVVEQFHRIGIGYTIDCAVFLNTGQLTLIDFSIEDPVVFAPIYG
jgi:hypothetical protein